MLTNLHAVSNRMGDIPCMKDDNSDMYYTVNNTAETWKNANENCKLRGGVLALVENARTLAFLKSLVQHNHWQVGTATVHTGKFTRHRMSIHSIATSTPPTVTDVFTEMFDNCRIASGHIGDTQQ